MGTEELRWDFRQDCERPLGHWFSFVNPRDKLWYGDKHIESSSRWYNVVAGRDDSCDRFDAHLKRIQEGDRKKIQPIATAGWFLCRQLAMTSSTVDKILVVLKRARQRDPTSLATLGFNLESLDLVIALREQLSLPIIFMVCLTMGKQVPQLQNEVRSPAGA